MSWLDDHPDVKTIRVATVDLNGQARGKRVPTRFAAKVESEGSRMPYSVVNLDMWGEDIENSPLVFDSGDADATLKPTGRGFVPMPWVGTPSGLLPLWMFHDDGRPFEADPRHALARVVERYSARGLTPVVATELEFYLVDDSGETLSVPQSPRSGKRHAGAHTLSLGALDAYDAFFTDLYDACEQMDIPADTAISEAGSGQFEINLMHVADPMRAADDAWLFKLAARGLARKHGFAATFMAKPFDDASGNGMHTHFSVLDKAGNNVFDNGGPEGSDVLHSAIAGCLAAMAESTLIFAPHGNSYERMVPGAHAPINISWAHENRTAAVRVPGGNVKARRVEHRVSGGDINPYLMLTAVLGAALVGIEDEMSPPAPITGNAYSQDLPQMPTDWATAIDQFEQGKFISRIFPAELIKYFVMTKRQELRKYQDLSPQKRVELYLERV